MANHISLVVESCFLSWDSLPTQSISIEVLIRLLPTMVLTPRESYANVIMYSPNPHILPPASRYIIMVRVIFQADVKTSVDNKMWVKVPRLYREHCVAEDFKISPIWRAIFFSQDINEILEAYRDKLFGGSHFIDIHTLPEGVTVDLFGLLAIVTIDLRSQQTWFLQKIHNMRGVKSYFID
ncbi:hypothetical protein SJS37_19585 [Aeromonas caviae]|uniref:hypothetical protein n=1 Tax=Aeromonas caviae TaxID=648 RepID=UPI0029DBA93D|nr:hypothetical protein [Aeromonas caviae]MDX7689936.1 hypothetical protein [Aeromonas caviae]